MTPPPLVRGLLDTPLVLAYRAGWDAPIDFVTALRMRWKPDISSSTVLHTFAEARDPGELRSAEVFCSLSTIHFVGASISRRAQAILQSLTPPSPLTPDEAIVAATALIHKLPLYTLDPARFGIVPGLTAIQPF